jgi:hypothetical protein
MKARAPAIDIQNAQIESTTTDGLLLTPLLCRRRAHLVAAGGRPANARLGSLGGYRDVVRRS